MPKYFDTLSTRIDADLAEKFKKLCAGKNCTVAKVLHDFILGQIEESKKNGGNKTELGREDSGNSAEGSQSGNEAREGEETDPYKPPFID